MLKQSDILLAARDKLKTVCDLPVYLDEVKEDFKSPCFFLKMMKTTKPDNIAAGRNFNECLLIVTYFAIKGINKAVDLYDIQDAVTTVFWRGLKVRDRYIHFQDISNEIDGEEADIVYIAMSFNYFDTDIDEVDLPLIGKIYHREIVKNTGSQHCNYKIEMEESDDGEIENADSDSGV